LSDRIQKTNPGAHDAVGVAPPGNPLVGAPPATPVSWGSLAILERLGEDHFGETFRAHDPALGREVTLRLRPADPAADDVKGARFLDEAKRLASVRHPNVLVVHGADRRDGRLGMWADRVAGQSLEELLLRDGPLPASEVRRVGLDLCHALTAIHAVGIIHREVRTSGVVREEGGRVVLMDSGSLGDLPRRGDEATDAGIANALALALAPEQLLGQGVNLSTDVYGLGVLLYRLVSGRYPVEAESLLELAEHHNRRLFEPLRDRRPALPLDFVRVVEKAIDPEPAQRYPNAVALERALASTLMATMSAPAPAAAAPNPLGGIAPLARLMRWRLAISSVAALAFGCLVAVMLMAEPSPSRISAPAPGGPVPPPVPDGPPAPAARVNRPRPPTTPAEAEPEEQWAYKPVPRNSPYGPPTQRLARPAAPPAKPPSGAVTGATAVLRALAQGPPMQAEAPAPVDSFAVLTLTTAPDRAQVTIDGVRQRQLTNATYRIEPGQHWILVEKLGYQPQQLPELDLVAGQKLRASMTLAPEPRDSLATP
jgi:serine/threonine protein kinase